MVFTFSSEKYFVNNMQVSIYIDYVSNYIAFLLPNIQTVSW